jgi:hypothetical protein
LQQTIARGGSRHRHLGLQDQSVEVATDQPADGDLALLRVVCNDDTKLPRGELPGHGQIDVEEKSGLQPWMVNGAALVTDIHDRIPVILAPADYDRWLGEEPDLRDLMKPYSAEPRNGAAREQRLLVSGAALAREGCKHIWQAVRHER